MDIKMNGVIATAFRPDSLKKMLGSLGQADIPSHLDKIVIIENGPRLGIEEILAKYPSLPLLYLYEPKANKSIALNRAVNALEGNPLVIFFDDDVLVDKNCLVAYAEAAQKLPDRAYLGGPTKAVYEKPLPREFLPYLPLSLTGLRYEGRLGFTTLDISFLGCNWACYRKLVIEAGMFDARFGPGSKTRATGQENEMQQRLRLIDVSGYYVPDALVTHCVPSEVGQLRWLLYRSFRHGVQQALVTTPSRSLAKISLETARAPLSLLFWVFRKRVLREITLRVLLWLSFNAGRIRGVMWRWMERLPFGGNGLKP